MIAVIVVLVSQVVEKSLNSEAAFFSKNVNAEAVLENETQNLLGDRKLAVIVHAIAVMAWPAT